MTKQEKKKNCNGRLMEIEQRTFFTPIVDNVKSVMGLEKCEDLTTVRTSGFVYI